MRWAALLLVAGCNQIYGLDPTRLEPDAALHLVTGQLLHRWAENDGNQLPVLREGALNKQSSVYVAVRIGQSVTDVPLAEDGSFSFTRAGETTPYQLVVTIDGEVTEIQHDAPALLFVVRTAGRFGAELVNKPITITFPVASGTSRGAVASTGIWSYAQVGPSVANYSLDWQQATSPAARHGLLDRNRNDVFYYYDFELATSPEGTQYSTIAGAERLPITMDASMSLPTPARVTRVQRGQMIGAVIAEATRLQQALPLFQRDHDALGVVAVPHLDTGTAGALLLASVENYFPPVDLAHTPSIFNPFEGSTILVTGTTAVKREVRHPTASGFSLPLSVQLFHLVPMSAGTAPTAVVPTPSIAIPTGVRVDGVTLDRDDVEVPFSGDREVVLDWSTDSSRRVDWYTVQLFEVREGFFDNTTLQLVRAFQIASPPLVLAPTSFVRDRYYMVRITAVAGFPGAKDGSLGMLTYPFSGVEVFTSMFRLR